MPRTSVATQDASVAGADIAWQTPDALGDVVDVGRGLVLLVRNASAGVVTVTLQTPGDVQGLAVAENAFTVDAGDISAFRLDNAVYGRSTGQADGGRAYIDYSAVASVSSAVLKVV